MTKSTPINILTTHYHTEAFIKNILNKIDYKESTNEDELLSIIVQYLKNKNIQPIISDYKIEESSPIVGLNVGCQIYKYSKNKHEKSAVLYSGKTKDLHNIYDIILAIAIEIQGLTEVSVTTLIFPNPPDTPQEININGNTYKSFIEKGLTPEIYLKNKEGYVLFNKNAIFKYSKISLDKKKQIKKMASKDTYYILVQE